jgi:ParB family chromosome partitioning protein
MLNKLSVSQALELTTLSPSNISQFTDHIIENELTIRQIREVKAVFTKEGLSGDDLELIANENINLKNLKTLKITKKTSLALKITLARLDSIIEEVQLNCEPEQSTDIISFLMDLRLKIHALIDDTIRFKNTRITKTAKYLKN